MQCRSLLSPVAILLLGAVATAQTTANSTAHFSGCFGGSNDEIGQIVRRSSNGEITLVGSTYSSDLPTTPNSMQPALAMATPTPSYGDIDAFVARFVPAQPGPGYTLQWCTYVGGTGLEFPFDAEVDASGITTVVGLSSSTDFPDPTGTNPPPLNGGSDGFLIQIDPTGAVCLTSMFFGGPGDDRINEVELDSNSALGNVTIAGITEDSPYTPNLPAATNAHHGGGTDAFVARVALWGASPGTLWSTYLGGSRHEALPFADWLANPIWMGNLDRMALTLSENGESVVVTTSRNTGISGNPYTSPNAFQPTNRGYRDSYFVILDPGTGAISYATLFGGSIWDHPEAIERHPDGGFVFAGLTQSDDHWTTPTGYQPNGNGAWQWDGFLCWLDPSRTGMQQLRYGTYFGTSPAQDGILALAVDSAGVVTIGGYAPDGVPLSPRCWMDTPVGSSYSGYVARLELAGQGGRDLHYSTYARPLIAGGTITHVLDVAIDDLGDVWFTGLTNSASYPVINGGSSHAGNYDAFLTHLELLPGGVRREMVAFGTPTCGTPFVPMHTGVAWPQSPNTLFGITVTDAPPSSLGLLVLGVPRATPVSLPLPYNGWLLVDSIANVLVTSNAEGHARFDQSLPQGPAGPLTWGFGAQWFFLTNPACPGSGPLGNSERLRF